MNVTWNTSSSRDTYRANIYSSCGRKNLFPHYCEVGDKIAVLFGTRALRDAHMVTFFFSQISWHVPIFQTCEANFSKPRTDMDTMFSLKVAQDPRLHFRRKKFSKEKFGFMGFFQKKFWKNAIFDNFSSLISYISKLRPNTMSMVSWIVQAFYRLHFGLKWRQKFFHTRCFWAKKRTKNFSKNLFSFQAHISQNW